MKKIISLMLIIVILSGGMVFAEEIDNGYNTYGKKFNVDGGMFDINSDEQSHGAVGVNIATNKKQIGHPIIIGLSHTRKGDFEYEITFEEGELEALYPIAERIIERENNRNVLIDMNFFKWKKNNLIINNKIIYKVDKNVNQSETYFSYIPSKEGENNINITIKHNGKEIVNEKHIINISKEKSNDKVIFLKEGNEIFGLQYGYTKKSITEDLGFLEIVSHSDNIEVGEYKTYFKKFTEDLPYGISNSFEKGEGKIINFIEGKITEEITPNLEANIVIKQRRNTNSMSPHTSSVHPRFMANFNYESVPTEDPTDIPNEIPKEDPKEDPKDNPNNTPTKNRPFRKSIPKPFLLIPIPFLIAFLFRRKVSIIDNGEVELEFKGGLIKDILVEVYEVIGNNENLIGIIPIERNNKIKLEDYEDKHLRIKIKNEEEKQLTNYSNDTELKG